MAWKCRIEIAFEKLRKSLGVFPFDDLKYSLRSFSVKELDQITDYFSECKLIGNFQFGKVYRGLVGKQDVTVKKWERPELYDYFEGENELRQRNEVLFLKQTIVSSHPNLAKLIGYCCEGEDQLFMVYDLKPLDSVHNLVLEAFWSDAEDVFAFGTLLLMLICKRVYSVDDLGKRVSCVHESGVDSHRSRKSSIGFVKFSQVHKSLMEDNGYYSEDGALLSKLAVTCVSPSRNDRPTMKEIVEKLMKLRVMQNHS